MEDIPFYSGVAGIVGLELISEPGRELARPRHKDPPLVLKRSTSDLEPPLQSCSYGALDYAQEGLPRIPVWSFAISFSCFHCLELGDQVLHAQQLAAYRGNPLLRRKA